MKFPVSICGGRPWGLPSPKQPPSYYVWDFGWRSDGSLCKAGLGRREEGAGGDCQLYDRRQRKAWATWNNKQVCSFNTGFPCLPFSSEEVATGLTISCPCTGLSWMKTLQLVVPSTAPHAHATFCLSMRCLNTRALSHTSEGALCNPLCQLVSLAPYKAAGHACYDV